MPQDHLAPRFTLPLTHIYTSGSFIDPLGKRWNRYTSQNQCFAYEASPHKRLPSPHQHHISSSLFMMHFRRPSVIFRRCTNTTLFCPMLTCTPPHSPGEDLGAVTLPRTPNDMVNVERGNHSGFSIFKLRVVPLCPTYSAGIVC